MNLIQMITAFSIYAYEEGYMLGLFVGLSIFLIVLYLVDYFIFKNKPPRGMEDGLV